MTFQFVFYFDKNLNTKKYRIFSGIVKEKILIDPTFQFSTSRRYELSLVIL